MHHIILAFLLSFVLIPTAPAEDGDFFEGIPTEKKQNAEEEGAPLLKVKRKDSNPYTGEEEEAEEPMEEPGDEVPQGFEEPAPETVSSREPISLSILLHTPLVLENTYDKRFGALGGDALLSVQLVPYASSTLYGELGLGFSYANLEITAPPVGFSHLYVNIPLRLRWVFAAGPKLYLELIGGLEAKVLELDSRSGGIAGVSDFFGSLDPELGVGISFPLSGSLDARFIVGLLYLSGGVEWLL